MANRDDFYKLDEFSFGQCLKILEEYSETRFRIEAMLTALSPDAELKIETIKALDDCFNEFGTSRKIKLYRSILAQIKKEKFPDEDD